MELLVLVGLVVLAIPVLLLVALVKLSALRQRVVELEIAVDALRRAPVATVSPAPAASSDAMFRVVIPPVREDDMPRPASVAPRVEATPSPALRPYASAEPGAAWQAHPASADDFPPPLTPPPRTPPPPVTPSPPDLVQRAAAAARRWFTTGNVPVKVGMLVLLAGVGALLKYASDQGWLAVPVGLRLAGVAAAAVAGLVFGWRRRDSHRSFALSVQGGMIGILLLVVFAAYRQFGLLPPSLAFAASVVLIAATGVLAVLQNARALAVFAILAGSLRRSGCRPAKATTSPCSPITRCSMPRSWRSHCSAPGVSSTCSDSPSPLASQRCGACCCMRLRTTSRRRRSWRCSSCSTC